MEFHKKLLHSFIQTPIIFLSAPVRKPVILLSYFVSKPFLLIFSQCNPDNPSGEFLSPPTPPQNKILLFDIPPEWQVLPHIPRIMVFTRNNLFIFICYGRMAVESNSSKSLLLAFLLSDEET